MLVGVLLSPWIVSKAPQSLVLWFLSLFFSEAIWTAGFFFFSVFFLTYVITLAQPCMAQCFHTYNIKNVCYNRNNSSYALQMK